MWEMGDIYNLWAEPEESIVALEGNTGFGEEAERVTIWGEAVGSMGCAGVCDTWIFTAATPDLE